MEEESFVFLLANLCFQSSSLKKYLHSLKICYQISHDSKTLCRQA